MKNIIKIIPFWCIAICFYLILYPIEILNKMSLNSPNSANDNSTTVFEQTNSSYLFLNIDKINKINVVPSFKYIINDFKPILKSCKFLFIKTYQKNSRLFIHHPFVCYKHPLSEHTAEG